MLLNDTSLLEALFDEAHVADVIGALEYEPEVPPALRPKHRDFLRDKVSRERQPYIPNHKP